MTKITSAAQALKAVESEEIKAGSILMDTNGIFEIVETYPYRSGEVIAEARELWIDEDGNYIPDPYGNKFYWTAADLVKMEY